MIKRIALSIILFTLLMSCSSQRGFLLSSGTITPTIVPAIINTQLARPIVTPTINSISRISNDFLPPPTPFPSMTPTNIFLPISSQGSYEDLVITLEHTSCFGPCPAYSLTIYGTGKGVYEGKSSVKVEGVQEFSVTTSQLSQLVKAFEDVHYFSFDDYYSVLITDSSTTSTSITFQGHSKQVSHYAWCLDYEKITIPEDEPRDAAPQALCDLEYKIGEIINVSQWTGR